MSFIDLPQFMENQNGHILKYFMKIPFKDSILLVDFYSQRIYIFHVSTYYLGAI